MKKLKAEEILYPISGTTLFAITFTAVLQEVFDLQGRTLFIYVLIASLTYFLIMIYMNIRES